MQLPHPVLRPPPTHIFQVASRELLRHGNNASEEKSGFVGAQIPVSSLMHGVSHCMFYLWHYAPTVQLISLAVSCEFHVRHQRLLATTALAKIADTYPGHCA